MKRVATALLVSALVLPHALTAAETPQDLPTGQRLTPTAAPGSVFQPLSPHLASNPDYVADGAAASALSPDGKTLLVLTSGYNVVNGPTGEKLPEQSQQYVIIYDVAHGAPKHAQTLGVPNAFFGVSWRPDGRGFYVSGGVDDSVHVFAAGTKGFEETGKPITLGHKDGLGLDVKPQVAGVAASPDGRLVLAANYYNDSLSLIETRRGRVLGETDLRPGRTDASRHGVAGGEYPFAIAWRDPHHVYVSSPRDREIVVLEFRRHNARVTKRIQMPGEPTSLLLDRSRGLLYVVEDNADRVAVIDTRKDAVLQDARLVLPESSSPMQGKGLNPNSMTVMPGGQELLVTLGGINALTVLDVSDPRKASPRIAGLVPTAWYPSTVAVAGGQIIVANRKSPPGPNPDACGPSFAVDRKAPRACRGSNQYIFQLEKAGLLSFPVPDTSTLASLSEQVARNIDLHSADERAKAADTMAAVRSHIQHVIFVVKENRTYDQLLGDLEIGNGDPKIAILGAALTPNHHELARRFGTFDNFYDSGEQSSTGWTWTTAGRVTDLLERTAPVDYAGRGLSYESEGLSRNLAMSQSQAERRKWHPKLADDDDLLPGHRHLTSPDGDSDEMEGQGYLWDNAVRAGLSVRNYGFANDFIYDGEGPNAIPPLHDPAHDGVVVYTSTNTTLSSRSDPYFRGYDQKFADYWRVQEWKREFEQQVARNNVPALSLIRISHDHFGDFDKAADGVNTVETQMADNDYALGLIVDKVAHSQVAGSTLVFVIEDDAQGGADHVDARRSVAFIAGPYVAQHKLVSTRYTTVSLLRTIEDVLGLKPMNLNDAMALPMTDAFDMNQTDWTFDAKPSKVLARTQLPVPADAADAGATPCPLRSSAYWASAMRGQDFSLEDRLDTNRFNKALWFGLKGDKAPVPSRDGRDLRSHRDTLLSSAIGCQG